MSRHLRLGRRFRRNRRPGKAQAVGLLSGGGRAFAAATRLVERRSYATAPVLAAAPAGRVCAMRRGSVQGSRGDMAAPNARSRRLSRLLGTPGRRQLALFAAVYLLYDCGRWAFVGQPGPARTNTHRVIHVERSLHVAVEGEVQRALGYGVSSFRLSNLYPAAQLGGKREHVPGRPEHGAVVADPPPTPRSSRPATPAHR